MHQYQIPGYDWPRGNASHLLKDQFSYSHSHPPRSRSKKSQNSKKSCSKKSDHSRSSSQPVAQSYLFVSYHHTIEHIYSSKFDSLSTYSNDTSHHSTSFDSLTTSFSRLTLQPQFSSYVPPSETYVGDLMNIEKTFCDHLKKHKRIAHNVLTEENALFVYQEIHDSLVKLVPPNSYVHLVIKPTRMWDVVLSAFRQIFYGQSTLAFHLHYVAEKKDTDFECDDRYAKRLCKYLAKYFNTNVTLISNDKYANFTDHQHLASDGFQFVWNEDGVPSDEEVHLPNELDNIKDSHRIFHFDVKM